MSEVNKWFIDKWKILETIKLQHFMDNQVAKELTKKVITWAIKIQILKVCQSTKRRDS